MLKTTDLALRRRRNRAQPAATPANPASDSPETP
jgi:hypothetical protein